MIAQPWYDDGFVYKNRSMIKVLTYPAFYSQVLAVTKVRHIHENCQLSLQKVPLTTAR